jgi:hypothetical protein
VLILFFAFLLMAPDGTWQRNLDAQPPFISAVVQPIPSSHVLLSHQSRPVFALRCAFGGRLVAQLHTGVVNSVAEPATSDMSLTRVRFAFDDGPWESEVWKRDLNVVTASADFSDRLEGAREVKIEVLVTCRQCGVTLRGPLPIVYRLNARGFTDARDALTLACVAS